ncbi:ankyrin repeat domain-containing protein [Candidatus Babela massiliensis]|uniref:Ankyrin repeats containing protein n=1 Tax=Candidatus Babela massiliensis TaxID=673862 RepID=V6DF97_9BACT|nr:ankyrin repeat domain-containing protein [Candidatus Babela massiliensis]CDK30267.1 Ankyrin repeats containing protein [Candidatus Babela massiliensis]
MKYKILLILMLKIFDLRSMSYDYIKDAKEYNEKNLLINLTQELKNKILDYIIYDLYKESLDNEPLIIFEQFDILFKNVLLISKHFIIFKDFLKSEIDTILSSEFFKTKLNENLKKLFQYADIKYDKAKLIKLINLGCNPDIIVEYNDTKEPLLFIAVRFSEFKYLIKLLLKKGANIDIQDSYGNTPLIVAAWLGYEDIISILIDHNASVNTKSCDGSTALIYASWTGNKKIVELLLSKYRESINIQNFSGDTALIKAAEEGYSEIVELLLNYGADTYLENKRGDKAQDVALYDIADIIERYK